MIAAVVALGGLLGLGTAIAQAASGQVAITATNTPPQPSGAPTNYVINFACSATEVESCGEDPTVTIPIDVTSSIPGTPPLSDWTFDVTTSTPGLVTGWSLVGGEIVVELDESLIEPGQSMTINLSVTPPNGYTPDGTSWEVQPTYESSTIPEAEAPTAAIGEAEAAADIRVSKNTNDGGSIYVVGNQVIYNITASCNPGFPAGSLYLDDARLVDTLPPEVVFVSATPAPTSAPTPPAAGGQVVWDFANPSGMPPGCVENPGGTADYQVIVELPSTVPDETVVHNEVTMFGTPIGETDELDTTADKDITAIDVPPDDPGEFLGKGSQGPLDIEGLGLKGTYPGHWIQPVDTTPSLNPGTAEGRYSMSVIYPASRAFQTDLVDPMPCLTNKTGVKYSSLPVVGDVDGSASAPVCSQPAFHPTVVRVASASMPQAIANSFQIELIGTDGSVVSVPVGTLSGSSAYFPVPAAMDGEIAAFRIPPNADLTDRSMAVDVWGYADDSTEGGEILEDITAATAYAVDALGTPAGTGRDAAELYIEPSLLQLAVHKSFGNYGSAAGGTTALNLVGGITVPPAAVLPGPAVLTDLLPDGMEWTNPPGGGTANFTLSQGLNNIATITGDVEYIEDYEGTGRNLIRVSFDPGDFPGTGYYRLTPPSNFILVSVPAGARIYTNTADMFASGSGRDTSSECGAAQGTDVSNFESEDPLDLDGDGVVEQNYCSFNDTLQVPGIPGPAFSLTKQVQGELDAAPKGPGGVAQTTNGGTGEYTIVWRNTGTDDLDQPVAYDILPYVGDTGVDQGQSSTPRDSQFQVAFDQITHLDPGISVEYSDSNNPCRPEVYPAAPGCVNDWVATPDDPADVRSLKFTASGTYESTESFEVRFQINLPTGEVNTIAWNSTAGTADVGGTALLPAEPPKVGITAPMDPVTPTLSTQVSSDDLKPGDELTDQITVGGADNINGTLDWTLYGPVDVDDATDCDGVDWSGAPTVDSGSFPISGTGDYETGATTLTEYGCYGYEVTISSPGFTDDVTSPVGSANEIAIIPRLAPTLSTQVSSDDLKPGDELTDQITVADADDVAGTLEWTLYGPVDVGDATDCDAADWTDAPAADEGSFAITGNGSYETGATPLTEIGCYGYEVTIDSPGFGNPVTSPVGSANEIAIIRRLTPTVSTSISSARVTPGGSVTDRITVGQTEGRPGEIQWSLVGPVALNDSWTCDGVNWDGAAVVAEGTLATTGDGEYDTPATTVPDQGCYGYVVTVGGDAIGGTADSPAGSPNEVVLVREDPGALEVTKKAGRKKVQVGAKVQYTIVVRNTGAGPVPDVRLVDDPDRPMEFVSAHPSQGTCNAEFPLTCELGTIEAGGSATVKVMAIPLVTGTIPNTATASTPDPEVDPDSDREKIKGGVVLKITKKANKRKVRAGGRIGYRIKVTNPSRATVRNVKVCDRPPAGLVVIRTAPKAKLQNGAWCWRIKKIPPRSSKLLRVYARALKGASGRLANVAWVNGQDVRARRDRAAVRVIKRRARPDRVTG